MLACVLHKQLNLAHDALKKLPFLGILNDFVAHTCTELFSFIQSKYQLITKAKYKTYQN